MDNPFIFGLCFLIPAVWMITLNLISRITGWSKLAAHYRYDNAFQGEIRNYQSVSMRMGTGYNNCVRVGAGPRGLHMSLVFIFRPAHPPLFVRWGEVCVMRKRKWRISRVELHFQRAADIPVIITPRLAQWLAQSAGPEWPEPVQPLPASSAMRDLP